MKERVEFMEPHRTKRWLTKATMMVLLSGCMVRCRAFRVRPQFIALAVIGAALFRAVPGPVSENELVFFHDAKGEINESDYRVYTGGLRCQCHA
jgi:hypothetical protein